ncbi:Elongation factor Tu, mitochondrial [Trichinella zimbabwensis]|uniref:protein-synthesizing GTPase n=1 Tax=Trichinella zimbabwensis TaxID=268475 RepID=A0A0V1I3D2_9BILA|nr:Elongation factor Tu, mitochondrial [Trichinella zimbabwensis]
MYYLSQMSLKQVVKRSFLPFVSKLFAAEYFRIEYELSKTLTCRKFCTQAAKENFNIGTIGHIDHGKTTLTAALTKVLSKTTNTKFVPFDEIDKAPEEQQRGITISIAHVGYETKKRKYSHTDCPGHKDFIKNMICGATQMDAAILGNYHNEVELILVLHCSACFILLAGEVVDAAEGTMPQTREHVMLAKQVGVQRIVVFINKAEMVDADLLELVKLEVCELLDEFGFDGYKAPIVVGSALMALDEVDGDFGQRSVERLLEELDKLEAPKRDTNASLILPVSSSFVVTGRGTVVVGTIEKGILRKGEKVQLIGAGKCLDTVASDIQIFKRSVKEVRAGDHVGVLCRHVHHSDVERGMWMTSPNSVPICNHFEAQAYFLKPEESGITSCPIRTGYTQKIMCTTWDQTGRLVLTNTDMAMPGDNFIMQCILQRPMPLQVGLHFTLMHGSSTIVRGVVTSLFNNLPVYSLKDTKTVTKKVQ